MIKKRAIGRLIQNRLLQHSLFWVLSFIVLARLFAYGGHLTKVDWIYTFLFHISLWPAVYLNLLWLIPTQLEQRKYLNYFILLIIVLAASSSLYLLTFNYLSDIIFPGYYFIAYYGFVDILEFVAVYIVLSSLLKLSKGWFRFQETQREVIRLEKEKTDAELGALKTQVNPHFLFNSLNNIYSLALDQDARTPGIILRLSEMMRYLLYETNPAFVPLAKELDHLHNYVEMQRLRVSAKARIEFVVKGNPENKFVAPLLFLPLVENGFKHGIQGETEQSFMSILLQINPNSLVFKIENNRGMVDEIEKNEQPGIGLANLRRRLDLIYPGQHNLEVTDGIHTFTVVLSLFSLKNGNDKVHSG